MPIDCHGPWDLFPVFRLKTDLVQVCLASAIALVIAISVAQVGTSPS